MSTVDEQVGFGMSEVMATSVAASGTQAAVVDLARPYGFVVVRFTDCQYISASTKLRLKVGHDASDTVCDVYDFTKDSRDLMSLPETGTFEVVIPVMGARRVQVILSTASEGGGATPIEIYGYDPIVD